MGPRPGPAPPPVTALPRAPLLPFPTPAPLISPPPAPRPFTQPCTPSPAPLPCTPSFPSPPSLPLHPLSQHPHPSQAKGSLGAGGHGWTADAPWAPGSPRHYPKPTEAQLDPKPLGPDPGNANVAPHPGDGGTRQGMGLGTEATRPEGLVRAGAPQRPPLLETKAPNRGSRWHRQHRGHGGGEGTWSGGPAPATPSQPHAHRECWWGAAAPPTCVPMLG